VILSRVRGEQCSDVVSSSYVTEEQ